MQIVKPLLVAGLCATLMDPFSMIDFLKWGGVVLILCGPFFILLRAVWWSRPSWMIAWFVAMAFMGAGLLFLNVAAQMSAAV